MLRRLQAYLKRPDLLRIRKFAGVGVSFPKSGRTWVRSMLKQTGCRAWWTHDGAGYGRGSHWQDLITGGQIWRGARVFLLLRDPRDTAVSGYRQLTERLGKPYDGSMSDFIRDPRYGVEKIARFNLSWLQRLNDTERGHLSSYELFSEDPHRELAALHRFFMDREPDAAVVRIAVEMNSFSRMHAIERAQGLEPEKMKARRGKIGGHRDDLTDDDLAYCDHVFGQLEYWERVDAAFMRHAGRASRKSPMASA